MKHTKKLLLGLFFVGASLQATQVSTHSIITRSKSKALNDLFIKVACLRPIGTVYDSQLSLIMRSGYAFIDYPVEPVIEKLITLLAAGADINAQFNKYNHIPLVWVACFPQRLPVLTFLLSRGASVNYQDKEGNSALHYAAMKGNGEAIQELLRYGADITLKNNKDLSFTDYLNSDDESLNGVRIAVALKDLCRSVYHQVEAEKKAAAEENPNKRAKMEVRED